MGLEEEERSGPPKRFNIPEIFVVLSDYKVEEIAKGVGKATERACRRYLSGGCRVY